MAKPTLYYAIVGSWHKAIVAVTSFDRSMYYGRYPSDDSRTSGRISTLLGKFDTYDSASNCLTQIKKAELETAHLFEEADKMRAQAQKERAARISAAVNAFVMKSE